MFVYTLHDVIGLVLLGVGGIVLMVYACVQGLIYLWKGK